LAIIVLLAVSIVAVSAAKHAKMEYKAKLYGANQVPPISSKAKGVATFVVSPDGTSMRFKIVVSGLKEPTAAHIHMGAAGTNGDVVAVLYPSATTSNAGVFAEGVITSSDLVGPLMNKSLSDLIEHMNSGNTYVNVHTKGHPDGEIRGQIERKH
jgi:hypothetical protein